MNAPRVSIIILNWNGWRDTIECLESVYRITYPNYDVIVVDNGSKDNSIEKIKEYAEGRIEVNSKFFEYNPNNKPIKVFEINEDDAGKGRFNRLLYEKFDVDRRMILIKNKNNYGFAGGNNVGIKFALSVLNPDYVLLLNNDTVVDRYFLTELVKVAESDENTGIVGPKIYYYDYNGRSDVINFTGADLVLWRGAEKRYGFRDIDKGQWDRIMSIDKIEGSCMLVREEVFKEVGLFDEKFFCYWEETDLCFRAKNKGYKIVYVPQARIWHKVSATSGGEINPFKIRLLIRNSLLFAFKNLDFHLREMFLLYLFLVALWKYLAIYLFYYKSPKVYIAFLNGILAGLKIGKIDVNNEYQN
ncbi:glycosyltransferase family 2 protein [Pyrococcus sp. ST04]|uniref:glycosyltransferase family 2 protein n=1 Tax=Pyrococcus sp. ST04 TaxID=1183377 RepID=UPI0002605A7E|nr:rhamnosyl transferase related protein [Pyrococcus sp. ST04]